MTDRLWTIPNILTLSRLPLSAVLFACIAMEQWLAGLIVFALAAGTDWLDGFLARRLNQLSAIGRNLDPLIDKVMTGGAFIYLMQEPRAGIQPWMTTVIVARELLITGLRGIMESQGIKFGADQLGKVKMALQCAVLVTVLTVLWLRGRIESAAAVNALEIGQTVLIYAMIAATIVSGLKYVLRAGREWGGGAKRETGHADE